MNVMTITLIMVSITGFSIIANAQQKSSAVSKNSTTKNKTTIAHNSCGTVAKKVVHKPVHPVKKVAAHKPVCKKKIVSKPVCKPKATALYVPKVKPVTIPQPVIAENISQIRSNEYAGYEPMRRAYGTQIGIVGGFNQNGFYKPATNDYSATYKMKGGFHLGLLLNFNIDENWAIQPGLEYIKKGAEIQTQYSTATMTVSSNDNFTLHYIEMPLNLVYKFGDPGEVRFMVGGGPYVSYLVRAYDDYQIKTTTVSGTNSNIARQQYRGAAKLGADSTAGASVAIKEEGHQNILNNSQTTAGNSYNDVHRLDWGLGAFVGCQFPHGWLVKAGGELGLRNIQQNAADGNYYNRNYSYSLSVGYLFGYRQ